MIPLPILKSFNPNLLLDHLSASFQEVENRIIPLYHKKIRDIDTGKKKEFEKLLAKFWETYERKKIEKEKYDQKIKDAAKRPSLHSASKTCVFRRMES